jgi:hypothetical protein
VITVGAAEGVQAFGGSDFCGIGDSGADSANDIIFFSSRGPTDDGRQKPEIMAPGTHVTGGVAQQTLTTGSGTGDDLACFTEMAYVEESELISFRPDNNITRRHQVPVTQRQLFQVSLL